MPSNDSAEGASKLEEQTASADCSVEKLSSGRRRGKEARGLGGKLLSKEV